jgi:hypothetical protein
VGVRLYALLMPSIASSGVHCCSFTIFSLSHNCEVAWRDLGYRA